MIEIWSTLELLNKIIILTGFKPTAVESFQFFYTFNMLRITFTRLKD